MDAWAQCGDRVQKAKDKRDRLSEAGEGEGESSDGLVPGVEEEGGDAPLPEGEGEGLPRDGAPLARRKSLAGSPHGRPRRRPPEDRAEAIHMSERYVRLENVKFRVTSIKKNWQITVSKKLETPS